MENSGNKSESHRQRLRTAIAENQKLVLKGRALLSDIDQGFAALKDQKTRARQRDQVQNLITLRPPARKEEERRILLVEDHPVVSRGLAELINYEDDLHVCGVSSTCAVALETLARQNPDLVILDLSLQEQSGLELLKEIRARRPEQRVLILSLHDELVYAPRALRAGALGYVMKEEATETLLRAIRKVLDGGVYLSPRLEAHVKEQVLRGNVALHPLETLSDRELEVFRLIGRGVSNRDISKLLVIRLKTVESHRTHIKQKLHLGTASELVQFAIEHQTTL